MNIVKLISICFFLLASQPISASQKISSCIGGFNGKRDLLLVIDDVSAVTKSVKAILINNTKWSLHDQSETMYIFKKTSFKHFEDEYVTLVVSKTGRDVSYRSAWLASDGHGFETEKFKCSGF